MIIVIFNLIKFDYVARRRVDERCLHGKQVVLERDQRETRDIQLVELVSLLLEIGCSEAAQAHERVCLCESLLVALAVHLVRIISDLIHFVHVVRHLVTQYLEVALAQVKLVVDLLYFVGVLILALLGPVVFEVEVKRAGARLRVLERLLIHNLVAIFIVNWICLAHDRVHLGDPLLLKLLEAIVGEINVKLVHCRVRFHT